MKERQNKFHKNISFFGAFSVALSLVFLATVYVQGQTMATPLASEETKEENASVHGITFPVSELGNCASKNKCKNYCDNAEHMNACIAFAKDRGLMTEKDSARAEKFTKHVLEKTSPGGCNTPRSCELYCSNISHLDECTAFAEKNGFKDEHYEQGKKIQTFLKRGGTTPGGCQTKEECQTYCGDFNHAKECFEFAQKAGILQNENQSHGGKLRHEPNAEQLLKLGELLQKGETPGGCATKDECEKYCSDASHREECIDFGIKIGFIKPDEGRAIKEMGGKGPGDCDSQESCQSYCDDQNHHEECFKFAEEHGFMTHEESQKAKEGWMRMRQGFESAPPEVQECLKTTLGANIIDDIQSGKLTPGPDIANQVRGCFENFGAQVHPEEAFKNVPPEIKTCLKEKFGDTFEKIRTGKTPMTPEMADSFRVCFQSMRMNAELEEGSRERNFRQGENNKQNPGQMIEGMLRSAPPEVVGCVKEKFPEGFDGSGTNGNQVTLEIKEGIRACFENFRPTPATIKSTPFLSGEHAMPPLPVGQNGLMNMPPEAQKCLQESLGEAGFQKLQTAPVSPEAMSIIKTCIEKAMPIRGDQLQGGAAYPSPQNFDGFHDLPPPIQPTSTSEPMTFLEKLVGAALLPLRWMLGK